MFEKIKRFARAAPSLLWLGAAMSGVIVMINPPFWVFFLGFIIFALVLALGYDAKLERLESRLQQAVMVASSDIKVQPEGPSFQEVLRAIPEPVLIIMGQEPNDLAGRKIIYANDAAVKKFRIDGIGMMLVGVIRTPEVLEVVDEALFGNITRSIEFDTTGASQDQYWCAQASPLPVRKGHQKLALLVMTDQTEIRRIERMRADFLANASHELRTPLASLTGYIDTLRGHAKNDLQAQEKFLDIMAAQAERMGRLIYDLLSLSRIEMNEHVPPSSEADVSLILKDVCESVSLLAQKKNIHLKINTPKIGLYPIIGDRDQIVQVIQNLVDNALKYAPKDTTIEIDVTLNQNIKDATRSMDSQAAKLVLLRPDRDVNDYYLVVRIKDFGQGIAREYLPRLAERFYRVEGQKSGSKLGTGLGLAIVKHIINRHRGGLMVESLSHATSLTPSPYVPDDILAHLKRNDPSYTQFVAFFPQKGFYRLDHEGPVIISLSDLPKIQSGNT